MLIVMGHLNDSSRNTGYSLMYSAFLIPAHRISAVEHLNGERNVVGLIPDSNIDFWMHSV